MTYFVYFVSVNDRFITEKCTIDNRSVCAPSHWDQNMTIYHLSEKMRCSQDQEFNSICDRVGEGEITQQDEHFFRSRILPTTLEEDNENFKNGKLAIAVTTNRHREQINLDKLNKLLPTERSYTCHSIDRALNISDARGSLDRNIPYTETGALPGEIQIKVGAPVVITANHKQRKYKEDGLMNGARGFIEHIEVSESDPELVTIIWMVFNNRENGALYRAAPDHLKLRRDQNLSHDATPILPVKKTFKLKSGNIEFQRKQFSLTLAYALTIHKVCSIAKLDKLKSSDKLRLRL